jgi:limonene-1,2-epoxide hydrolase
MTETLDAQVVVRRFLADMAADRVDDAIAAFDDDVVYTNVGLATLRGRRRAGKVLELLRRPLFGFEVELVAVAAEGGLVFTERVDELRIGPLRIRFWVVGRFDVRNGRIVLWRDYFDNLDIAKGVLRGIVALLIPGVQRPLTPIGD